MSKEQKISLPPPKQDEKLSQSDREEMETLDNGDNAAKAQRGQQEREEDEPIWLVEKKKSSQLNPQYY